MNNRSPCRPPHFHPVLVLKSVDPRLWVGVALFSATASCGALVTQIGRLPIPMQREATLSANEFDLIVSEDLQCSYYGPQPLPCQGEIAEEQKKFTEK